MKESSAGRNTLSSVNKQAETTDTTLDRVESDESPKTSSPSYALFASGTEIEATSSPSPVSEYEEGSLVILADEQDKKTDVGSTDVTEIESSLSKPALISRRKLSEYLPPEEQVIPVKVTAVDPEKPYRTPESSEQEQLEKSIASTTGDVPADAAESDLTNFVQAAPEPELVVKRTVISQEETVSAVNALLGESFEEPVEATAPQPVDSIDDNPLGSCADDEAAAAVAGLAAEMSPDNNEDWHNVPADAAESDLTNFVQATSEPELVVERTVSAGNALLDESFEEPVEATAPQPVDADSMTAEVSYLLTGILFGKYFFNLCTLQRDKFKGFQSCNTKILHNGLLC